MNIWRHNAENHWLAAWEYWVRWSYAAALVVASRGEEGQTGTGIGNWLLQGTIFASLWASQSLSLRRQHPTLAGLLWKKIKFRGKKSHSQLLGGRVQWKCHMSTHTCMTFSTVKRMHFISTLSPVTLPPPPKRSSSFTFNIQKIISANKLNEIRGVFFLQNS